MPKHHPAGDAPSPEQEKARAKHRRELLGIHRPPGQDQVQWGLALSGGGIRSATFCLGVLQGLSRRPTPSAPEQPLIQQFDYVSTVSGGGYIGSFFNSLFVKGRLTGEAHETDEAAARGAYAAMLEDPPGRLHSDTTYDPQRPGRAAMAWLRDNGRYMAPTGTGDMIYDAAIAVRNWAATQYVVGSVIVMVLALLLLLRLTLAQHVPAWLALEQSWRASACQDCLNPSLIWWSPTWWFSVAVIGVFTLPVGLAFWFSHPAKGETPASRPSLRTKAAVLGLLVGIVVLVAAERLGHLAESHPQVHGVLQGGGLLVCLAVAWFALSTWLTRKTSIMAQRVVLTRWLSLSIITLLGLATLSAIETLAQTALLWLTADTGAVTAGIGTLVVWLMRAGALKLGDKNTSGWTSRIPAELISGVIGIALWMGMAACWDAAVLASVWPAGHFEDTLLQQPDKLKDMQLMALATAALVAFLGIVVGRFPGFLNLSTLQSLYSARLTRAYLGASNHQRFVAGAPARFRDVAEPIEGDSLDCVQAYANPCAPTHFINVCVNQTVSPGEQLMQHDRKGKPLVIAPKGFYFDRQAQAWTSDPRQGELTYPLAYGEWVGVSGAAFSTGLGRGTGLGFSLALGFANVRLGRWWAGIAGQRGVQRDSWWRRLFTPQTYLIDELRGRFYAEHRQYQYLSDGGHFENTAAYELLNPARDRDVRLIVLCDCGCDPDYEFEDLANLIRLARIDHGLEIRLNEAALLEPLLQSRFGRPEDFRRGLDGQLPRRGDRCAVLLDVFSTSTTSGDAPAGQLRSRIILVKPNLLASVTSDVSQYQRTQPSFPQETTIDQFFDEGQWESYRQLGLTVSQHLFPQEPDSDLGQAFWRVCLDGLDAPARTA